MVIDPLGRRIGTDPSTGLQVNDFGAAAWTEETGTGRAVTVTESEPGRYRILATGTVTGTFHLEFGEDGEDGASAPTAIDSWVTAGVSLAPFEHEVTERVGDTTPPTVIPPPSITVFAPSSQGITLPQSPDLQRFIQGGAATDAVDPEPVWLATFAGAAPVTDTTLLAPGRHEITFAFDDSSGNTGSGRSFVYVVPVSPAGPGIPSITGSVSTAGLVTLSWTAGTGAAPTRYVLRAGTAPGGADLGLVDMGRSVAAQGTLPPGVYYVSVVAENAAATVPSNEVRLRVGAAAPAAPKLNATAVGRAVTASWTEGSGALPESYTLVVGSRSGTADLATLPVGLQTSVAGQLPAGTYYFRVEARTVGGVATSNEVVLRPVCAPPAAPGGLRADVVGGQVHLAWAAAPGATSYRVFAGSAPGTSNLFVGDVGAVTALSAAPPLGTYFVKVAAVGECGASQPGQEVVVTVR